MNRQAGVAIGRMMWLCDMSHHSHMPNWLLLLHKLPLHQVDQPNMVKFCKPTLLGPSTWTCPIQ